MMEREVFDEDELPTLGRLIRGQVLLTGIGSLSYQCINFLRRRCYGSTLNIDDEPLEVYCECRG